MARTRKITASFIPPGLAMEETILNSKNGPIWHHRPSVTSTGLLSIIWNRKHRPGATTPPLFRDVAFAPTGLSLAAVDARGHLTHFNFILNRYYHVKHTGSPGIRIVWHPLKKDEVIVSSEDGLVRSYCLSTGSLQCTLSGHKRGVHSLSFDKSGRLLLSASLDTALVWSTLDWSRLRTMGAGTGIVQALFIPSIDGICAGFRDNSILVWDCYSYDVKARLQMPEDVTAPAIESIAASADGAYLACGTRNGSVLLWELVSQVLIRVVDMPLPSQLVTQLCFLADDRTLAVLSDDGHCILLTVAAPTCKAVLDISTPERAFIRFGIDPSGRYIACCASDGRMVIHDMEAARKHRLRVKEAQLRMGISGLATEPKIVRPPTPDPPRRSHDSSASVNASRRSVSPGKVSSAGRPPIAKAAIVTASTRRSKRAHKHAVERSLISDDDEKDVWSGAADSDSSSDSSLSVEGPSSSSRRDTGGSGVERVKLQSPARAGSDRIGTGVVTSKLIDTVFPKPAPGTDVKAALSAAAQAKRSTSVRPTIREFEATSVPLYRLATMNPQEITVTDERLLSLLSEYGRFPAKFRCMIWRFLLRLPENHAAFTALVDKGVHPAYSDLHLKYPLKDSRLFRRLRRCLSALAHWSAVMGELEFLPELAFPFVKVYEGDSLSLCEAVMAVLLNWCGTWAEMFPYPPLGELGRVRMLLEYHDPQLADHLQQCNATPDVFAWPMLRTLLSEVLSRDEWCELWDHLITNAADPSLLLFAVVSYVMFFRISLLTIVPTRSSEDTSDRDEIESFLRRQNPISVKSLVKTMYSLRKTTPQHLIPSVSTPSTAGIADIPGLSLGSRVFGGGGIAGEPCDPPVATEADVIASKVVGRGPAYMLSVGQYPPFTRFPKFVVDFQLKERERIVAEEEALRRMASAAEIVGKRNAELTAQEHAWKEESALLLKAEEARLKASRELELEHKRSIDALVGKSQVARLQRLAELQEASRGAADLQMKLAAVEAARDADAARKWRDSIDRVATQGIQSYELTRLEADAGDRVQESLLRRKVDESRRGEAAAEAVRRQADMLAEAIEREKQRAVEEKEAIALQLDRQKYERLQRLAALSPRQTVDASISPEPASLVSAVEPKKPQAVSRAPQERPTVLPPAPAPSSPPKPSQQRVQSVTVSTQAPQPDVVPPDASPLSSKRIPPPSRPPVAPKQPLLQQSPSRTSTVSQRTGHSSRDEELIVDDEAGPTLARVGFSPPAAPQVPWFPPRVRSSSDSVPVPYASSARRYEEGGASTGKGQTSSSSFSASGSGYWTTDEQSSGQQDVTLDQPHMQVGHGIGGRVSSEGSVGAGGDHPSGSSHSYDVSGTGSWHTDNSAPKAFQ